jgi:hypothetical protein
MFLYFNKPPNVDLPVIEYWRSREKEWPYLAAMAFDFLAVSAMLSKYKRVFVLYKTDNIREF